jgi:hypothetical protein
MKTTIEITKQFPEDGGPIITIPAGTKVKEIPGAGGGLAIDDDTLLVKLGAWAHDVSHRYCWVKPEQVADRVADARLIRDPLKAKSDDWQETAHHWIVTIGGQAFDYYTGLGHRVALKSYGSGQTFEELSGKNLTETGLKKLLACSKATPPKIDDVLHSLVMDADACEMSFADWCGSLGYDEDSRKAFAIYEACQKNATKLRKAGVDICAERERLADY